MRKSQNYNWQGSKKIIKSIHRGGMNMFSVGEKVLSRYGVWHKILFVFANGRYECERLEDGEINIISGADLRKAREQDERTKDYA